MKFSNQKLKKVTTTMKSDYKDSVKYAFLQI